MVFLTDQMTSKFFHSIKKNAGLSAILSPFLHSSLISKKDKGERKDVIPYFFITLQSAEKNLCMV